MTKSAASNTNRSRRKFLGLTFLMLSAASFGCRQSNDAPRQSATRVRTQGTNAPPEKWPDNAAGRFFVANTCIDCDLCRETAPLVFKRNEKEGYCYISKQPGSDAELKLCLQALEGCPVEAIVDTKSQGK